MRVRLYNQDIVSLSNDSVTGDYGPIRFGPIKEADEYGPYRISQEVPDEVGEAMVSEFEDIRVHEKDVDEDAEAEEAETEESIDDA